MFQGRLAMIHPGEVENYKTLLISQNKIDSSINEISKSHPDYQGYYLRFLTVQGYKEKSQRIFEVLDRFTRRVYINGYLPSDIDSSTKTKLWLNEKKLRILHHFSQFDQVENIFGKVKPNKINFYVDFKNKETPL